jgi:hypothetical protein
MMGPSRSREVKPRYKRGGTVLTKEGGIGVVESVEKYRFRWHPVVPIYTVRFKDGSTRRLFEADLW